MRTKRNQQNRSNSGKVSVRHFVVYICMWKPCCCSTVQAHSWTRTLFIIFLVSRRDEVAGIRAKFPSKIPVSIMWGELHNPYILLTTNQTISPVNNIVDFNSLQMTHTLLAFATSCSRL